MLDVWDSIIPELKAVVDSSRDAISGKGRNPDEVWKKRSEEINLTMRMAAVGMGQTGGPMEKLGLSADGGARGVKQLSLNEVYQPPSVTSGELWPFLRTSFPQPDLHLRSYCHQYQFPASDQSLEFDSCP
jgi:hypothetical protein